MSGGLGTCPHDPCRGPRRPPWAGVAAPFFHRLPQEILIMGKYLIAWLLGVPAVVLVLLYLFFS
jgi:hypothetical protein